MAEVLVGDRLDHYTLDELLARSGMASIFKATDVSTGEVVALKIPHLHLESDVVFYERFKREEKIGQRLDHPGIIRVRSAPGRCRLYIVMEYIDGRSLRRVMDEEKAMAPPRALALAIQLAEALEAMHAQGVVHRDLKPENVLLTAEGRTKILDFGIALDESARRLTWFKLSSAMGTPDYMAPEQIGGRRGDARTDVYALGTMLYEMLTANLPHSAPNPHALVRAKMNDEPRPPTYYVPALDRGIEALVLRAIERDPRDRYPSMAALLADLRQPSLALEHAPERTTAGRPTLASARLRTALVVALVLGGLTWLMWQTSQRATMEAARGRPAESARDAPSAAVGPP